MWIQEMLRNVSPERLRQRTVKYGAYNAVAGRADSRFAWQQAKDDLGYSPEHNWPEIPGGDT